MCLVTGWYDLARRTLEERSGRAVFPQSNMDCFARSLPCPDVSQPARLPYPKSNQRLESTPKNDPIVKVEHASRLLPADWKRAGRSFYFRTECFLRGMICARRNLASTISAAPLRTEKAKAREFVKTLPLIAIGFAFSLVRVDSYVYFLPVVSFGLNHGIRLRIVPPRRGARGTPGARLFLAKR